MRFWKEYRWIRNLMIISQLMLLGLVAQWLSSQYRQERDLLINELNSIYKTSATEAMDSLLYRFIVSPVLADTSLMIRGHVSAGKRFAVDSSQYSMGSGVIVKGNFADTSIRVTGYGSAINDTGTDSAGVVVIRRFSADDEPAGGREKMSVSFRDTTRIEVRSPGAVYQIPDKESEILMRSVRMIITTDRDSTGKPGMSWKSVSRNIDTSLFIGSIERAVENRGFNISVSLGSDTLADQSTATAGSGNVIIGYGDSNFPAIKVNGSVREIVGNILPEILFALLLLMLTATAFILSYKSLRSQIVVSRIRDEFISNISHELKTPVATVKLALEAIGKFKGGLSDETVKDYLSIASLETERLDRLVTRVLDYGRIEGGGNGFNFRRVDLMTVIQGAIDNMTIRTSNEGATVNFKVGESLYIMADSFYLEGVFGNIIDNSLKYCSKPVIVDISVITKGSVASITISDNGPGIPEEYIKKVFDKFFRVPADNLHNTKGYGLGLSFAKMVVESHGGTIAARNIPEGGCSFIVTLPLNDQDSIR